jgi:hypothetical protein
MRSALDCRLGGELVGVSLSAGRLSGATDHLGRAQVDFAKLCRSCSRSWGLLRWLMPYALCVLDRTQQQQPNTRPLTCGDRGESLPSTPSSRGSLPSPWAENVRNAEGIHRIIITIMIKMFIKYQRPNSETRKYRKYRRITPAMLERYVSGLQGNGAQRYHFHT